MAKVVLTKEIAEKIDSYCNNPSKYKVTHDGVPVTHVTVTHGGMVIYEEGEKWRKHFGDEVSISVYEKNDTLL